MGYLLTTDLKFALRPQFHPKKTKMNTHFQKLHILICIFLKEKCTVPLQPYQEQGGQIPPHLYRVISRICALMP